MGAGELTLPAASRHVPVSGAPAASGPEYVADVQLAIPDVGSVPVQPTVTGFDHQPLALAGVAGTARTAAGGVWSILTTAWPVIVRPPLYRASQVLVTPGVSPLMRIAGSQPDVWTRPSVPTSQCNVTALRYHPPSPASPLREACTPGGAAPAMPAAGHAASSSAAIPADMPDRRSVERR